MLLRLENAAASMSEMQRHQDRVANNLANADTVGYKRDRLFTTALNERLDAEGAPRSDRRFRQGNDLSAGTLEETGNPLDVALGGDGFFVTQNEATGEQRYTRAGHFVVDNEGTLRTPGGLAVMGEGGPLQLPVDTGGAIEISKSGEIRVDNRRIGSLRVVTFDNPQQQLQRAEGASFAADGAAPQAAEDPLVLQGTVETSNVDPVAEMTDMIEHFRLFESQQKALRTTDSVLSRATRDLGEL
jgi:flagellar basal-body rod protein FlgF/flagellar basal-body rod protein FlgG